MDKWEQIAFVGNVYNRLVCYKGSLYPEVYGLVLEQINTMVDCS